ncbi:hypothetical protein DL96DRAFT_1639773 [Flagelloscypha sp. PMI_526]|nr:hypothetical protein DL96DRAFT_1639773 [Flagelloscypha sp. PMI_526]
MLLFSRSRLIFAKTSTKKRELKTRTMRITEAPLSLGDGTPPYACTREWTCKSSFMARAPTKTIIAHFVQNFSTHWVLSCSSRCCSSRRFLSHKPKASLSFLNPVLSPDNFMLYKLSFKLQPHTIPVDLIQDSLILHQESASASAPSQRSPPKLAPLPRPPLPVLAVASSIQATLIGQAESVIEKDNRPLIKRGTLPLRNTAARTGMGSLTPLWNGLVWTARPVDDVE